MIEAILRILCDIHPPGGADAIYLFSQTKDNESSVIHAGKAMFDEGVASQVLLLKAGTDQGYPGFESWKRQLVSKGLDERQIGFVELRAGEPHHTLTEAAALIDSARSFHLKSIVVCAAPFHQVRAFMTCVRVAMIEYPEIRLYSRPGAALSWQDSVIHSQGVLKATRTGLIRSEFERIDKYYRKGDLISFEAVLDYLDKRDHFS